MPPETEIIFRTECLLDGTGAPARAADVAVAGGRIAGVAPHGSLGGAPVRAVPALAPGFVDIHAHGDIEPFLYPEAESKVLQGVTTEVSGNCGASPFPLRGAALERMRERASAHGVEVAWRTAAEYFAALERRGLGINRLFLCGHNTLRAAVAGYEDRPLTPGERARMQDLLAEALAQGAAGLSTGFLYPPGCYAGPEEVLELARAAAARGRLYTTHMRSEGPGLLEAVDETCDVARRTGVRTQISHVKTSGRAHWDKIDALEERLRREAARLDLTCDRYPYTAAATDLDAVLPSWAYAGGAHAELARLRDPAARARLLAALAEKPPDYWKSVLVSAVRTEASRRFQGRRVNEVAEAMGLPPAEAVLDLLLREETRVDAIFFGMSEENMRRILAWPFVMVGSDSTARNFAAQRNEGNPHPRSFGTFPRILACLVRDTGVLPLEEAVRKMTSLPASRLGLAGRGAVREGFAADLVAFDPETVRDTSDYAAPWQRPEGIETVLVNGTVAVEQGEHTGALAGRVLRSG